MRYEDFISRFPKVQKTTRGVIVKCPSHNDGTASLSIGKAADGGVLLKCFAGCETTSIVASLGLTMKDLFAEEKVKQFTPISAETPSVEKPVVETIYRYQDATGKEVYQALRLKPKSFRQRHMVDGSWVWTMDGVERVLYHLPEIMAAKQVWIVEGEKDADNLAALGFTATCNVGGAGKWLDGYTASLTGKEVAICGDTDEAGQKHVELVFNSIAGTAKNVRLVKLPAKFKDVSDYIASFKESKDAKAAIESLQESAHPFISGIKLPIYSVSELERGYQKMVANMAENSFSLSKWLPSLGRFVRPLIPGELVCILGDTGAGKTGLLSMLALSALPLPTILFELELPPELLFERLVSAKFKMTGQQVEAAYKGGELLGEGLDVKFKNLFICSESRLTLPDLENYIVRSELKLGQKPKLVLLDYIQLMGATGVNRREKISDVAEGLKVLAKTTGTIIIVASQVRRPDDENPEIGLHSAKESGSIEQSAGLLLGAWRDLQDSTLLHLKVLKSTKGGSGSHIFCNFDGAKMIITERTTRTPIEP